MFAEGEKISGPGSPCVWSGPVWKEAKSDVGKITGFDGGFT